MNFSRLNTYGLAELQMEGDGNCQVLILPFSLMLAYLCPFFMVLSIVSFILFNISCAIYVKFYWTVSSISRSVISQF